MKTINLRLHYPHCQQDKLVGVSEEVFDVLCQSVREMRNYERRRRYHRAYYSLDAYDWTENYALEHSPSPEQLVMLAEEQTEREAIQRSIDEDSERITALERIISRVYEDMIAQRISEDNFNRILENSQTEQATLKNRVILNRERLAQQTQEQEDNTRWLEIIKDYADIQELDAVTLNRLVQKIVIHEDIDGDAVRQTVEIHFNFNDKAVKCRIIREK